MKKLVIVIILSLFLIKLVLAGPASPNIFQEPVITKKQSSLEEGLKSISPLAPLEPGETIIFTGNSTSQFNYKYDYKLIICTNDTLAISCGPDYESYCFKGTKLCESETSSASGEPNSCSYTATSAGIIGWKAFTCNSNRDIGEDEQINSLIIGDITALIKPNKGLSTLKYLGIGISNFAKKTRMIFLDIIGIEEEFIAITTCQELQDIQNDRYSNYEIINDIDCSKTIEWNKGNGFIPIRGFFGILEGNNYEISDLYIQDDQAGLFYALCRNATLRNLEFIDVKINILDKGEGGIILGGVSCSADNILIENIFASGEVYGGGDEYSGGLFGRINRAMTLRNSQIWAYVEGAGGSVGQNDGQIINSSFAGTANGTTVTWVYAGPTMDKQGISGGFVGWNFGTITTSFSEGIVYGLNNIGGFVGGNEYVDKTWRGEIFDSYSIADVKGADYIGGFVGYNVGGNITNCYSTGTINPEPTPDPTPELPTMSPINMNLINPGMNLLAAPPQRLSGGFLAYIDPDYECINSFWNKETSEETKSACAVQAKTTMEMQDIETYENWNFENTWRIPDFDYPELKWEPITVYPHSLPDSFCSQFNPLGERKRNAHRKECVEADWMDNEPSKKRPKDCRIEKNIGKDPLDDECVPDKRIN